MVGIKDVTVVHDGRRTHVSWIGADGNRYHFWFVNVQNVSPEMDMIHKNPPLGTKRNEAGYFDVRRLDARAAVNRIIVEEVRRRVIDGNLVQKAIAAHEERERRGAEEARRLARVAHVQLCGPQLLAALKEVLTALVEGGGERWRDALAGADAAIAEAEREP